MNRKTFVLRTIDLFELSEIVIVLFFESLCGAPMSTMLSCGSKDMIIINVYRLFNKATIC